MFMRRLALSAVISASGLMVLGVVSAQATTALRTDPGGALLTGSTSIQNTTSGSAVAVTSLGTVSCAQTTIIGGRASRNISATTITGTGQLTSTSCTDTIAPINIISCKGHGAFPTLSATALSATGGTVTISDSIGRCTVQGSTNACYFTSSSASGSAVNATSTISFTNIGIVGLTSPSDALSSGLCGNTGTLSVTLTHGVNQSGQTLTITTS